MSVYTIKYVKNSDDGKITVTEDGAELACFSKEDPNFKALLDCFPILSDLEDGMEMSVSGTSDELKSKYDLELEIVDHAAGSSEEGMEHGEEGEVSGELCEKCGCDPCKCGEEVCEKCGCADCICGEEPSSEHLEKDAKQLDSIESRVAEIEATLSGMSKVFGAMESEAESIEGTVEDMEADDAKAEELPDMESNSDEYTEPGDSKEDDKNDESFSYSGSRVWSDPAEFTDSSDALSDEKEEKDEKKEEDLEENSYDMYDEYEEWVKPKKEIRKFKML